MLCDRDLEEVSMKRPTKRLTTTLAALTIAAAQAALAQPPVPPPGGDPAEHLAQELSLNDTQKAQVKQIFAEQRAKREAARAAEKSSGQTSTPEARRAQAQQSQAEVLQKLGGVLTPAQLTKFKEIQQERRQHMQPGGPPPSSS
jgi:Spy/CpxP family protein refolding chaperone